VISVANALTKESAGQLYLTATIVSYLADGGLNTLGQRTGDIVKFLLHKAGISDPTEFEDRLQETLDDASKMFPLYIKEKEARKRASRRS